MIEASVWIAPSIWNWVSDSIERSVAETTPIESDCSSPKGLPIAATGCADLEVVGVAELERLQVEPVGIDLEQGDVGERVEADDLGRDLVAVGELDVDLLGLVDRRRRRSPRRVGDDVGVGDDLAVVVDDEARALAGRAAAAEQRRRRSPPKTERIVTTPGDASLVDLLRRRSRRRRSATTDLLAAAERASSS